MNAPKVVREIYASVHVGGRHTCWKRVGLEIQSDYWGSTLVMLSMIESGSVLITRPVEIDPGSGCSKPGCTAECCRADEDEEE